MEIKIRIIPHFVQRYDTCGDWNFDKKGNLTIYVSETPRTGIRGSYLIAVHELVEALLCRERGITAEVVDRFDLSYDKKAEIEPGDHPDSPYRREHNTATGIERILASELGIVWSKYEDELNTLSDDYEINNYD